MNERVYVSLLTFLTVVTLSLWLLVVVFVSPDDLGWVGVFLFLANLGAFFFTSSLLLVYAIRVRLLRLAPAFRHVQISFREGGLIAVCAVFLLLISHYSFWNVVNASLVIGFFVLIDLFFIFTHDRKPRAKA